VDQWKKLNAFLASVGLFNCSKICSTNDEVNLMEVNFLVIVSQFCFVLNELDIEVTMLVLLLLLKVVCERWCLGKVSLVKSFRGLELKLICVLFSQHPSSNLITDGVNHDNTCTAYFKKKNIAKKVIF
jgi:hypothetical protein